LNEPVHRLAQGIYQKALHQAPHLRRLLEERSRQLIGAGYHAQVHVGEDSTLLFAARQGNREPIRQRGKDFYLEGRDALSPESLQTWVAERPLDFTPSALLRPIVQDSILPTVAYVAGPAELAYLAQSQAFYPEFGRPLPVVLPRASFTLADRRQQRLFEKYHLTLEDVWQGEERLRRKIASAGLGEDGRDGKERWAEHLDQAERALQEMLEGLQRDVEPIDPTLLDAARNAHEKMAYQLERLRGKISRAALERSEILKRHEQELLRFLLPDGHFQEREVGGVYFLGRVGYELLDRLLAQISRHCSDHQFLVY
ncbi:MAG TPA: bacillithiol biosynthesis BshC, partial [Terriglobia bacterium]|nr:bacillithiol biosynthesis BshC [Terriglobia bacterium]